MNKKVVLTCLKIAVLIISAIGSKLIETIAGKVSTMMAL